jgi:hypothetical protein
MHDWVQISAPEALIAPHTVLPKRDEQLLDLYQYEVMQTLGGVTTLQIQEQPELASRFQDSHLNQTVYFGNLNLLIDQCMKLGLCPASTRFLDVGGGIRSSHALGRTSVSI